MAIETGLPDVPSYEMNYGGRGNTLRSNCRAAAC
jgi:hypothetical protein